MKMWPPVLSLLSSSSSKIQLASAWIVGTAVQNNDKAQVAILKYQPLAPLLSLLESSDMDVRSKAMYALSGLLKHNPEAVVQFQDMDGWNKLKLALLDPNIILRRKTVFLINSLLFQDPAGQQESSSDETSPAASASVPPPNSTATAVAPAPQSSSPLTAAPLERGPETLLSGVEHPDVAKALISSELLKIILISLLPSSTDGGNGVESIREKGLMLNYGPDGDQEPRRDLDYSEKAARCLLTFTEKLNPSTTLVDEETLRLLNLFAEQLRSEPIEEVEDREGTRSTRATELSIEQESLDNLERKLREIKVTGDRL
ncbi:hypothetical protein IE53DRAFT_384845 [Violaceomyces palustris]|uniref:Uncharacterized protein n=1 Tax=Violaceomyces palustris TaxID=1673888 RepID=A0ACD0P3X4_9BASI|nr:hypothetical protein IE53DRAFT_384845 [Violaceomyces palustris]